jgi:hypothetical protein
VSLSSTVLLIQSPIYAQNTGVSTACSLAGNIQINYPTNNWIVRENYEGDPDVLTLDHTYGQVSPNGKPIPSDKALINIHGDYIGQMVAVYPPVTSHEAGESAIQTYGRYLEDFELVTQDDYFIQDRKFVNSNPAYLFSYIYNDSNWGYVNGITLVLTSGEFIYYISLISKPEITSELWPTFEQMIPTFFGSLFASDPGPVGC